MKIRLHILGLPHTITNDEYSHCAFTGKVLRFSPMMKSRDFEVFHYGIETSESGADKHFDVLSLDEFNKLKYESYKFLNPTLSDEKITEELKNKKNFVGDLANVSTPLYNQFNKNLKLLLQQNYRSINTDIVCLPFGYAHEEAIKDLNVLAVETGIGYPESYKKYRIFESYAKKHLQCGFEKINHPSNYWFVIPNYYDLNEWPFDPNGLLNNYNKIKKIGYFGRITHIKGLNIFVEISRRFPNIEFIMCGQGNPNTYLTQSPNLKAIEPLEGKERGLFLSTLTALITPSLYIEPFCGVNVEAQLCGVPVIANDFGAFAETIEPFKTGLLCHTLADYCYGVQMALDDKFDNKYIRDRAVKLYDMYNVAYQYEYVFRNILDLTNENNGWYSPYSYISLLDHENKKNNKIPYYYFYTPDYEPWNNHLTSVLSNHFDLFPIKTDSIPNLHIQHANHHFTGCYYKVELIIDAINKNMGKKIVFSDVTWYVNPNKVTELKNLIDFTFSDMTFANNGGVNTINIGFIVINCTQKNIDIWEKALEILKKDNNAHDQSIITELVKNPSLFNSKKIVCCWPPSKEEFNIKFKNDFLMFKIFTPCNQDKITRDTFRMNTMKEYGFDIFS